MSMTEDKNLITMMEEYERLYRENLPVAERLESIKQAIKDIVGQGEESISHRGVKATFRKAHERVFWDGKGLDGYAVSDPKLLAFRSVREYKASVSVGVSKAEGGK